MSALELLSAYPQIVEIMKKQRISDFREFQEQAIEKGLLKGKNLLISAPTGSGKTLIGELAILKHLLGNENQKALFLVPLKAVADEKYDEFCRKYEDFFAVKVSTGDFETIPEELSAANLIIATYERFDSLLRTKPDWLPDIAVIVIDEVHMIGQKERGSRLESVIIRLKEYLPYTQLICLSATVKNWEELSDWLQAYPIISNERTVPLTIKTLVSKNKNKLNLILKLVEKTILINGQVLIFAMTRRDAEFLAERIANQLERILKPKGNEIDADLVSNLSIKLKTILPKGVGYHHAGLISSDRKIVESYFRQGIIKVIVCTTTLSAGINVPARLVVIKDIRIGDSEKPLRTLTSNEIFQILGRAGRPGLDEEGIGIILAEDKKDKEFIEAYMYTQTSVGEKIEDYEPILSQFNNVSTLREQVLVKIYEKRKYGLTEDELISFFKRTFWAYLEQKSNSDALPKYAGRGIEEILSDIESTESIDKAKLLFSDIELLSASKNRLLGRVGNYIVSFDENKGHYCNCGIKNSKMCLHRIAFSLFCDAHKELEAYKKTIVRNALEKDIFTYLNQANMIKIRDGKYFVTDFGRAAVLHYIRPETSQIIRNVLLNTSVYTTENILLLGMKILTEEFSSKYLATELFDCVWDWINERELNEALKIIEPGDFESIRSSINWILNAILGIGRSMSSDIEKALEKIVKSLTERIRVGVKEELIAVSPFFEYTERKKLRRLYELGIKTVADLINKKEAI